jgi:hypothetical protein
VTALILRRRGQLRRRTTREFWILKKYFGADNCAVKIRDQRGCAVHRIRDIVNIDLVMREAVGRVGDPQVFERTKSGGATYDAIPGKAVERDEFVN